jgi:F-type H+-transporting ATPase subunit alpha
MDDVDVDDVRRFEREMREHFKTRHSDLLEGIRESGKLPEGDVLDRAVEGFKETFAGSSKAE